MSFDIKNPFDRYVGEDFGAFLGSLLKTDFDLLRGFGAEVWPTKINLCFFFSIDVGVIDFWEIFFF